MTQFSDKLPAGLPLSGQVHLWVLDQRHTDNQQAPANASPLAATEIARMQRFVTRPLQYRFWQRRSMLRQILSHYRPDIDPVDWRFITNSHGRPQIDVSQCNNNLFFNLTHTKGMTVLAIACQQDMGVDVENTAVDDPPSYLELAGRFFSDREALHIRSQPKYSQIQTFFNFWTLKEAYIKAVGKGLAVGLDRFEFTFGPASICIHFPAPPIDDPNSWSFAQHTLHTNYRVALALKACGNLIDVQYFQYR